MNREVASMFATSSVIYDSVDAALDSAINFNKEASGYVQYLTGEHNVGWPLRVVKNDTIAKESCANLYETDYTPDDSWCSGLQLDLLGSGLSHLHQYPGALAGGQHQQRHRSSGPCQRQPRGYVPQDLYPG